MSDAVPDPPARIGLVDSHCHLHLLAPGERERALDHARARGVEGFLVPALHLDDAETLYRLAEAHPDLWIAVGVHPHEASRWRDGDARRLRALLDHPSVVAVGECGLDYHYDRSPRPQQRRALAEQWEVAVDARLPAIVHNRDSDADMLALFGRRAFAGLRAVFHSYCAGAEMARALLARPGIYLGLSGMVTFPAAHNVREVLGLVPPERLLVETDTPYLAPVPHRGRPNQPAWVVEVAARVAAELDLPPPELHRRTGRAFLSLFDRARPA